MKMIRHGFDRDGADIGGEVSVQRAKPLALGEPAIGPEAGDLSEGMNPGIGPARSDEREPGLGDCCEGIFDRCLDGRPVATVAPRTPPGGPMAADLAVEPLNALGLIWGDWCGGRS